MGRCGLSGERRLPGPLAGPSEELICDGLLALVDPGPVAEARTAVVLTDAVEREDLVGIEDELQPLLAVQLFDGVFTRAYSVVQFAHSDSAHAHQVCEHGGARRRRLNDD